MVWIRSLSHTFLCRAAAAPLDKSGKTLDWRLPKAVSRESKSAVMLESPVLMFCRNFFSLIRSKLE